MLLDNDHFATGVHLEMGQRKRQMVSMAKIKPMIICSPSTRKRGKGLASPRRTKKSLELRKSESSPPLGDNPKAKMIAITEDKSIFSPENLGGKKAS
jgi:hypothetical protein